MQRRILLILTILSLAGIAAAQVPAKPAPGQSDGVLGPQLIAWSEIQKPQPVPQKPEPLPPPDGRSEPPQSAPPDQAGKAQQPEPETQQSTSQSVAGTIVKTGNKYVLETVDNVDYQLDDQDRAKEYEGKHVRVMGTLDRSTGILHIKSIELIS